MKKVYKLVMAIALIAWPLLITAQTRVVCIGNSITEGYGLTDATQPYPYQLGLLLGSGFKVSNFGASGTCMVKNDPASYWNTNHFINAKNADPQILIIELGTNDADPPRWNAHKGEFYNDYVAMIAEFRKNGRNPRIFISYPTPCFGAVKAPQDANIRNEVFPILKQIASSQGVNIIDFNDPMSILGNLFPDGIHPNAEGAKKLARIVFDAIVAISGKTGTYSLQNRNSGMYMDLEGGSTADLAKILQWTGTGGTNQQFRLTEVSYGVYTIVSVASGKYLDIAGANVNNDASCLQWGYTGGNNQRFTLLATDNGYYKLKAVHSARVLDVSGASTAINAKIIQWDDNNQSNAQWKLNAPGSARVATVVDQAPLNTLVEDTSTAITLYPNPSSDIVTLTNLPANSTITVMDLSGNQVMQMKSSSVIGDVKIDVSELKAGDYLIKIGNREVKTLKVLKR